SPWLCAQSLGGDCGGSGVPSGRQVPTNASILRFGVAVQLPVSPLSMLLPISQLGPEHELVCETFSWWIFSLTEQLPLVKHCAYCSSCWSLGFDAFWFES